MGHQIIKQPNGKFALWSSIVDNYILVNAEREDIIEYELGIKRTELEMSIGYRINQLNEGVTFPFCYTWESSLDQIEERHGKKSVKDLLKHMEEQ